MAHVHALAHVAAEARLAADVVVEPGVVVEAGVVVAEGTILRTGTVLYEGTRIGARCRIGPYAVIGGEPMDRNHRGEPSYVRIEDDVSVREFATIHRATGAGEETVVGSGTLVMCYVHLGHNVTVGSGCVLTNSVQLGGHVQVGDRAVVGGGVLVHQFCRVGSCAMVGGASAVNRDVLPFAMAQGSPARHLRANRVGLERRGWDADRRKIVDDALRLLRAHEASAFADLAREHEDVAVMREFVASSERGIAKFAGRG